MYARLFIGTCFVVGSLCLAPSANAFDEQAAVNQNMSPADAFVAGSLAYQSGDTELALEALELAARMGHPGAQWKLGQMYAAGDGVERDDLKAFEYFSHLADQHADDNPRKPSAKIIANAFVAVAGYYLSGIPDSPIVRNLDHAADLVRHAATYFGDPDAQYQLARMYLEGQGTERNPDRAIRWFAMAAKDNHVPAQSALGNLLWNGSEGIRQRPDQGLMWLEIARQNTPSDSSNLIIEIHAVAFAQASPDQRERARARAERWLIKNRDD